MFQALLLRKILSFTLGYLDIYLFALTMNLNNQNNIRYGMPSDNCMKKRGIFHMCLALFVINGTLP